MFIKIRQSLLALVFLIFSHLSVADNRVELFAIDYPPYMMVDDDGIRGIDVDVTIAAFAAVGIEATISTAPWKRILKNLEYGRIAGTLSCSMRPDRERFIAFSDPISEASQVMVFNRNTQLPAQLHFEDLKQYQVVAVEGWGIEKELTQSGIAHHTVPDISSGINAVVFRDVDIFYNGNLTTLYRARQMGLADKVSTQRFIGKPSTPFHLCMSKAFPGTPELLEKFNQGLQQLRDSGEYQKIYTRYLGHKERG